jgi:DNA-directed RNA polymerase subunit alpha
LKKAASVLIQHFILFADDKMDFNIEEIATSSEFDEDYLHTRQLLKTRLADMELSVRALNCLKAADVEMLGELVSFSKNDLLKFRNFGKKSLIELEDFVKLKGLDFGMNIAKYKLDFEKES